MSLESASPPTYHSLPVTFTPIEGTKPSNATVHYISAGSSHLPRLLLLHGFPSSSYQFRNLIPLLSSSYHIIAPDLPGFGLTTVTSDFTYTFDNLAAVINSFLSALDWSSYAIYVFDYGAPVGLRIASSNPTHVKAIVTQNGNAYVEGFGQDFWAPIFALWKTHDSVASRQALQDNVLTLATTQYQYEAGVPAEDLALINPQTYHLDYLQNIAGPENARHQLDLFYDYRNNVEKYPAFQQYFRESRVPILAVWGSGDPAFIPAGAEAFQKDSPDAVVRFVEAGHFALETKVLEIAGIIREWLKGIGY